MGFESLIFLDQYNLKFNKVASAMVADTGLLKQIAERKKYILFLQVCVQLIKLMRL